MPSVLPTEQRPPTKAVRSNASKVDSLWCLFRTTDKKVFKLDGAEKVKSLIGDKVVLEGALDGETITVSSAAKAE